MTDEEREQLMNFLLEGQARHEVNIQKLGESFAEQQRGFKTSERETAQLRRVLHSAIRLGRRERSETREKFNALINAQIRTEESLTAFQSRTEEMLGALQSQTHLLTKAVSRADERIDKLEEAGSNGGRP